MVVDISIRVDTCTYVSGSMHVCSWLLSTFAVDVPRLLPSFLMLIMTTIRSCHPNLATCYQFVQSLLKGGTGEGVWKGKVDGVTVHGSYYSWL